MTEQIVHETEHPDGPGRYTVAIDGTAAGELTYRTVDGSRVIDHTEVDDAFTGQGVAGRVVQRALDDAAHDAVKVVPLCPYVAHYLDSRPEQQFLVDRDLWSALGG